MSGAHGLQEPPRLAGSVVDMGDRRHGLQLVLLVLPVLLGLVGMHALVAPAALVPAADTSQSAAASMVEHPGHRSAPPVAASASAPVTADDHDTPAGHGDHDAAHVLHLCLAVLAAIGLALVTAWLFLGRLALPISVTPARQRARGMPAQRPPPVPRRLAQLCVMRT